MQFDKGFLSPYMATDREKMRAELDEPLILLTDKKISNVRDLVSVLEHAAQQSRSLLIVAEDIEGEAQAAIILNLIRGSVKVCAVKTPGFGDEKQEFLEDIAILTGATVITEKKGLKLDQFKPEWLGKARKVQVDNEKTIIVEGKGDKKEIDERKKLLESQTKLADSQHQKTELKKRLAKLGGGVAVIKVGAATETELKEKKMRIDDALNATKAAVEEGVIPGGGLLLLKAQEELKTQQLTGDESIGFEIVQRALEYPVRQIATNAGKEGAEVVARLRVEKGDVGYNAKTDTYEDLSKAGVIDPTKVVRSALQNAASISGMILTTEALVTDYDDEKDEQRATIIL